jgi:hypothetical protein
MNHDDFESRLQRTPLKRPPTEWRDEILTAAANAGSAEFHSAVPQIYNLPDLSADGSALQTAERQPNAIRRYGRVQLCATANASATPTRERAMATTWRCRMRELFWPHPVAWGVMAALWVLIGAAHLAMREPGRSTTSVHMATFSDAPTLMTMQRELLALREEPAEQPSATPVRPIPPQSCIERRRMTLVA